MPLNVVLILVVIHFNPFGTMVMAKIQRLALEPDVAFTQKIFQIAEKSRLQQQKALDHHNQRHQWLA